MFRICLFDSLRRSSFLPGDGVFVRSHLEILSILYEKGGLKGKTKEWTGSNPTAGVKSVGGRREQDASTERDCNKHSSATASSEEKENINKKSRSLNKSLLIDPCIT